MTDTHKAGEREAFEAWRAQCGYSTESYSSVLWIAWIAACKWQRKADYDAMIGFAALAQPAAGVAECNGSHDYSAIRECIEKECTACTGHQEEICPACKGAGQIATGCDELSESICRTCDGSGVAAPVAQVTLTGDQIRAAVRDARNQVGPSDAPQPSDYVQAGVRAILAQAPSASAPQAPIDLTGLADRLLAPREIVRDEYGHLFNPAFPILDEGDNVRMFLGAFGIDLCQVSMESDCHDEALFDAVCAGEKGCGEWMPTTPEGEGWLLSDIFDTEDGPYAQFIRRKPKEPKKSRSEHLTSPTPSAAPVAMTDERGAKYAMQAVSKLRDEIKQALDIIDKRHGACGATEAIHDKADAIVSILLAATPAQASTASAPASVMRWNPLPGGGMNPHPSGMYVRFEDLVQPCAESAAQRVKDATPFLKRLKSSLMHQRRFGDDTLAAYRRACTDAEAEIEEWLLAQRDGEEGV